MEKPGNKYIIVFTTGDISQVSYRIANGRTEVTLELESRNRFPEVA